MECHLCGAKAQLGPWLLGQEVGRDGTGIGEVDDDLVPPAGRCVLLAYREHLLRRLMEAERHHLTARGEAFAGAQEERDPRPPPVVDLGPHRRHGLGVRARRHARLGAVPLVLAAHHMPRFDRLEGLKDLDLLVAQVLGVQRRRGLHGHEPQDLEEVGHDHVAVGARLVVEAPPPLDRQRLGHIDLHVADVLAVPQRLEQAIGETEGQDVVDRLLAEEVVNPEDLRFAEDRMQRLVEGPGRGQIGAEGLLDDDAGADALGQAGRAEHDHRRPTRVRRDGQMEEPTRRAAEFLIGAPDRPLQRGGVTGLRTAERKRALEGAPCVAHRLAGPELGHRLAGMLAELLAGQGPSCGADDTVPVRQQAGDRQAEQPREKLAPGQVACRPEQDDDVVIRAPRGSHGPLAPGRC